MRRLVRRHVGPGAAIAVFVTGWLLVIGMLVAFLAGSQANGRRDLAQRLELRATTGSEFAALYIRDLFARERAQARSWLADERIAPQVFRRVAAGLGSDAAVLLDRRGRVLQVTPSAPALLGRVLSRDYEHLAAAVAGRPVVSNVVRSPASGVPAVGFAVPFETPSGRRVFNGAYDVSRTPLGAYMRHLVVLSGRRVYLIDAAGSVIASNRSGRSGAATVAQGDPQLTRAARAGRRRGSYDAPGGRRYFVGVHVAGTPWRMLVSVPERQLYSSIDGASRWLPWVAIASLALAGLVILLLVSRLLRSRARLARLNAELAGLARVDALTGLKNRRGIEETLAATLSAARRHRTSLAVLMIDIDHFKHVNDTLGHANGDAVLARVARILLATIRTEDAIGRWGGEEFLAVLPATDAAGAVLVAERLRVRVAETGAALPDGPGTSVTVTIGVAVCADGETDDLVQRADAALYAGKAAGRDNVFLSVAPASASALA